MLKRTLGVVLGLVLLVGQAAAGEPDDTIRAKLRTALPNATVTGIKPAPMPGFYQVQASGYDTFYVSADGRYVIDGDLLELRGSQVVNLTDEQDAQNRKAALAAANRQDMIVFPAVGKPKGAIYVFTDVECAYCRKLHAEVPALNKMGIEVRYLAFPRSGPRSPVATKMAKVWCSVDRNSALTDAKKDIAPAGKQRPGCKSPVDEQFTLGLSLGVNGTPAVFLEDGTQVGGYVSAPDLAKEMHLK